MKVSKWGNSLAIRIPADVVERLSLAPGDEIKVQVTGADRFQVRRDLRRREAIEAIKKLRVPLPKGYVFRRSEIYDEEGIPRYECSGLCIRRPARRCS